MPLYSYVALEEDKIRLLHLEPGFLDEPLRAKLVTVPLNGVRRSFEALSYAWESNITMSLIHTPDGQIALTQSLDRALRRLRLPDRVRILWADAVCINQKDNVEKSSQVSLMGEIYGAASKTVIYLGQEADNSTSALEMLVKIGQVDFKTKDFSRFPGEAVLEAAGLPGSNDQIWTALRKLWCRPWFLRVWVIQEFVRGYASIVICGDWEGNWTSLWQSVYRYVGFGLVYLGFTAGADDPHLKLAVAGSRAMNQMISLKKRTEGYMSPMYMMLHPKLGTAIDGSLDEISQDNEESREVMSKFIRPSWESEHSSGQSLGIRSFSILELLAMCRPFLATDERDHFFAPLGLSSEAKEKDFAPNYDESLDKVIHRYTSALIERGHCMELLSHAGLGRQKAGYPSWVPHLLKFAPEASDFQPLGTMHLYTAAGKSKPKVKLCRTSNELTIRGAIVDGLTVVGMDRLSISNAAGSGLARMSNILELAVSTLSRVSAYPTGEPIEEVMWRTFIANRSGPMQEAPSSLGEEFRKWREFLFGGSWKQGQKVQDRMELALSIPGYNYMAAFMMTFPFYKLCVTIRGYIGLVPLNAQVGDFVVILNGGDVPFIVRSASSDSNKVKLVGESYIHGFMKGREMKDKARKEIDITIV